MEILMATPAEVQQRKNEFLNSTKDPAFSCIKTQTRQEFIKALGDRCDEPSAIAQGNSSLCGPAAFIYCIAREKPDDYAMYVLDLALGGEGSLGNLKVSPRPECRNGVIKVEIGTNPSGDIEYREITPVDWVALASLRDSSNASAAMKGVNSDFAGMTFSRDITGWFNKTDWFRDVRNCAYGGTPASDNNLFEINTLPASYVCMHINAEIMVSDPGQIWGGATHWIVLGDGEGKGGGTNGINGTKIWISTPLRTQILNAQRQVFMTCPRLETPSPIGNNISCRIGDDFCDPDGGPLGQEKNRRSQGKINFKVYTWGEPVKPDGTRPAIRSIDMRYNNTLVVGEFLKYYFGYVAARLK
jgi:hypothetical protein